MAKGSKKLKIPTETIHDVVQVLEQWLTAENKTLTPSKKAELVVLLCEEVLEHEKRDAKEALESVLCDTVDARE